MSPFTVVLCNQMKPCTEAPCGLQSPLWLEQKKTHFADRSCKPIELSSSCYKETYLKMNIFDLPSALSFWHFGPTQLNLSNHYLPIPCVLIAQYRNQWLIVKLNNTYQTWRRIMMCFILKLRAPNLIMDVGALSRSQHNVFYVLRLENQ